MAYTHIQCIDIQMCIGMGTFFVAFCENIEDSRKKAQDFKLETILCPWHLLGSSYCYPFCTKLLRFALLQVLKGGAMVFLKVG